MANVLSRADWNDLLQFFNDARTLCSWYSDIDLVDPKHKWSKLDIMWLRLQLREIAKKVPALATMFDRWDVEWEAFWDTFEFPANLGKWEQWIMDEFNLVRSNYECKCTEALAQDVRELHGTSAYAPYTFDSNVVFINQWNGYKRYQYTANWSFSPCIGTLTGFEGVRDYWIANTLNLTIHSYGEMCYVHDYEDNNNGMGSISFNEDGECESAPTDSYSFYITVGDLFCPTPSVEEEIVQVWNSENAECYGQ